MSDQPGEAAPAEFGLRVESLTPERAQRVGMEGQKGVLVTEVEPASFAEDIGFSPGDVISEVNGQSVTSVEDYRKAVMQIEARRKRGVQGAAPRVQRPGNDRVSARRCSGGRKIIPGDRISQRCENKSRT